MEIGTLNQRIAFLEHSTKVDGSGNLFSKTFEEHNQKIQQTQGR